MPLFEENELKVFKSKQFEFISEKIKFINLLKNFRESIDKNNFEEFQKKLKVVSI